jgi:hypothetical protein
MESDSEGEEARDNVTNYYCNYDCFVYDNKESVSVSVSVSVLSKEEKCAYQLGLSESEYNYLKNYPVEEWLFRVSINREIVFLSPISMLITMHVYATLSLVQVLRQK